MVLDPAYNAAKATLASAVDSTQMTFTFEAADAANLPIPAAGSEYNVAVADASLEDPSEDPNYEIVRITGGSGNDRTVTRGQEGTTGKTHSAGHHAWVAPTKKFRDDIVASVMGDVFAAGTIELDASGDLAVPSGRTGSIVVDSNGATGDDDLVSISGGVDGQFLILKSANSARDITLKNGAGLKTPGAKDIILDTTDARVVVHRDGSVWYVVTPFFEPHDHKAIGPFGFNQGADLTIATGLITVTDSFHLVDTEAAAASDDLDDIAGGFNGMLLLLMCKDDTHSVNIRSNQGTTPNNIRLGTSTRLMDTVRDSTLLFYANSQWHELPTLTA